MHNADAEILVGVVGHPGEGQVRELLQAPEAPEVGVPMTSFIVQVNVHAKAEADQAADMLEVGKDSLTSVPIRVPSQRELQPRQPLQARQRCQNGFRHERIGCEGERPQTRQPGEWLQLQLMPPTHEHVGDGQVLQSGEGCCDGVHVTCRDGGCVAGAHVFL